MTLANFSGFHGQTLRVTTFGGVSISICPHSKYSIIMHTNCSLCYLMTHVLSNGHSVSFMAILFYILANHQIQHQATREVGCQPGDCRSSLNLPQGLTISHYNSGDGTVVIVTIVLCYALFS